MIDNHKGLHRLLPYALLGYRTTIRMSTGAISYISRSKYLYWESSRKPNLVTLIGLASGLIIWHWLMQRERFSFVMINCINKEWFVLSTKGHEPECLKLVSWFSNAFSLITMSTKGNLHQTSEDPTCFAKCYLEVPWSCQRWMAPNGQDQSTQMLSRDTMFEDSVCIL